MNMLWKYKDDFDGLWPKHIQFSEYLQKQYATFVKKWVEYPVLEIGSGTGWLRDFLNVPEGLYLGIDISSSATRIGRSKGRDVLMKNFMNYDENPVNTVISIATVQYQEDLLESFRKIRSILSSKGRYVFIERFTDKHHDEEVIKVTKDKAEQLLRQVFPRVEMWHFDVNFLRYLILKKGFPDGICKLEPVLRKLKLHSWYYAGVCQK